jgi:thioredoxin-like negative regulator of GroEL
MQHEVNTSEELKSLIETEKGLLLYFYSDRCAPCISLRPKVEDMTTEDFPQMKIVFINSEKYPEIAAHHGVFANPAILVYFEEQEFRRYSKYISISQLGGDIERIYNMVFDNQYTLPEE